MPKSRSLFRFSSYRRKLGEKIKPANRKSCRIMFAKTCIVFTVFSLLLSLCGPVGADRFLPVLPQNIVSEETCVSVSLTTPASTVFINVTDYDAQQILKNITVEFREPVAYVSFSLDVLRDRPPYAGLPSNKTVLQYYTIRFLTEIADKIRSVTMVFAVEKAAAQERDEVTLVLYQYEGGKSEERPAEKFEEDDAFVYFKTETEGSSYIAVTRAVTFTPWWLVVVIIAAIVLVTLIGICAYRRGKLANLTKLMGAWHGK